MTVFFTKTCARDWERCCYQMRAIRRLFPLAMHVVLIETDEWQKAVDTQNHVGFVDRELGELARPPFLGTDTRVLCVDVLMPEAMRIENPDIRQQYCKLRAPVVLGEDTIQLDSDMCPKPTQPDMRCRWMDELYGSPPRWYAPEASKAMQPAVENWLKTYKCLFDVGPNTPVGRDFMRSQFGWYIPRDVARDFLLALGPDPIATILQVVEGRMKFSEYQLLGMWAADNDAFSTRRISFLPYAEKDPWLMHFSSKDALEPDQRKLLRQAAGLE